MTVLKAASSAVAWVGRWAEMSTGLLVGTTSILSADTMAGMWVGEAIETTAEPRTAATGGRWAATQVAARAAYRCPSAALPLLPCHCRTAAIQLPCRCRAASAVPLPCRCRAAAAAVPLPCQYFATAVPLPCPCCCRCRCRSRGFAVAMPLLSRRCCRAFAAVPVLPCLCCRAIAAVQPRYHSRKQIPTPNIPARRIKDQWGW